MDAHQLKSTPAPKSPVKVFLRPYRGERIERSLTVRIPAGLTKASTGFSSAMPIP